MDHDVMDVLLQVPTAVVSYSIPGYICTVMVSLLFAVCGCMAAKGNSSFCASCFCCCNGCNFVFSLIGLISLSVFVTVALDDVDGKLREYLSFCDPVAVCGEDLHSARVVDCLAASAWPKEYTRHFIGGPILDPKCPHIFLACNGSDAMQYRSAEGDDLWERPGVSSRGEKPVVWWPDREPERRLAIERASALRRASLSHGSRAQKGDFKPRPMPQNPLAQCNVSHAAVIWHGLFEEEPEMVAALRAYFTTRTGIAVARQEYGGNRAILTLPLLALAACGCWYGQELRSKIQVGGWRSGHDQEMMVMVQQPLMVQVPEGVPAQALQLAAQPAAQGLPAQPFVLRPPEAVPVAAFPEHE
ncbi:unnamed protein product [Prorocentrum cordatum]|uniref:Uncharacterized protein n=1 Tax=Prorocentrum cordatum TaxID=2364126 RepID=A0ABN9TQP3_9DINO|nr:unnamed protein product [Polarella glacialis]